MMPVTKQGWSLIVSVCPGTKLSMPEAVREDGGTGVTGILRSECATALGFDSYHRKEIGAHRNCEDGLNLSLRRIVVSTRAHVIAASFSKLLLSCFHSSNSR